MIPQRLVELPVPGSGCGDIRIVFDGINIRAEFEYRCEGADWVGSIHFINIVAYRFRDELHSVGYCSQSYDSVAQVDESDWLAELLRGEPPNKMGIKDKKHYTVFFSSNGYFEVIADRYELQAPLKGFLNF